MVIGDSHILCIAGDIDHLKKQKTSPHAHILGTIITQYTRHQTFFQVLGIHPSQHPCKGGSLDLAKKETSLETDLLEYP